MQQALLLYFCSTSIWHGLLISFSKIPYMKRIYFLILSAFASVMAMAQEASTTNVDVNLKGDGGAAGFPWLWVIGGIVFVLLLVALLSGGRGTDRVVHKKTVIRE